ncbi:MAG: cache domain-containing protein [Burkholderiaceae bacterium]|nr:cache domain-containing protein [Burkholderiaceae bacterium]
MKNFYRFIAFVFFAGFLNVQASAETRATADEAVAMVKAVQASLKANGKDKTFADIADLNNKTFHDRELYVIVFDLKGMNVAHGNNPKIVGKDLSEMRDPDGTYITKNFLKIANSKEGKGWFDYKWVNPVNKLVEPKSGYIQKDGDYMIVVGIYK